MKTLTILAVVVATMGLTACSNMTTSTMTKNDTPRARLNDNIDWEAVAQANRSARLGGATLVWINYPQKHDKKNNSRVADTE